MFSHIMVGANDMAASRKFYDALLGTVGSPAGFEDDKGRVFWITPTGIFSITKPIDGNDASPANGGTIGFAATSPEQTDDWHRAGTANGGTTCEEAPGWRDSPLGRIYLAYLRDPSGNKLCALHNPG